MNITATQHPLRAVGEEGADEVFAKLVGGLDQVDSKVTERQCHVKGFGWL